MSRRNFKTITYRFLYGSKLMTFNIVNIFRHIYLYPFQTGSAFTFTLSLKNLILLRGAF